MQNQNCNPQHRGYSSGDQVRLRWEGVGEEGDVTCMGKKRTYRFWWGNVTERESLDDVGVKDTLLH
jgi:hypothetical protein